MNLMHIYRLHKHSRFTVHISTYMIELGLFIEKSLYQVFGRLKLHKIDLEIYFIYFRKLSRFRGQFSSTE